MIFLFFKTVKIDPAVKTKIATVKDMLHMDCVKRIGRHHGCLEIAKNRATSV